MSQWSVGPHVGQRRSLTGGPACLRREKENKKEKRVFCTRAQSELGQLAVRLFFDLGRLALVEYDLACEPLKSMRCQIVAD